jgi:hypothetical protein
VGSETDKASHRQPVVQCRFCGHCYIRPCAATTQAGCLNVKLETPLSQPQASIRLHYIPVFYLNRWRTGDKKICEYSRPRKAIYDRRIHPVQTGFQDRLHEPSDHAAVHRSQPGSAGPDRGVGLAPGTEEGIGSRFGER